jgi:hypothetical protein
MRSRGAALRQKHRPANELFGEDQVSYSSGEARKKAARQTRKGGPESQIFGLWSAPIRPSIDSEECLSSGRKSKPTLLSSCNWLPSCLFTTKCYFPDVDLLGCLVLVAGCFKFSDSNIIFLIKEICPK